MDRISTNQQIKMNDDELIRLWIFSNHVKRLGKIMGPIRKMSTCISMPTDKLKNRNETKNTPTELRLSATINEIRPFMLQEDPTCFRKIWRMLNKKYYSGGIHNQKFSEYKKQWDEIAIVDNKPSKENALKMSGVYQVDSVKIETYYQLVYYFIYGKYMHNDKSQSITATVDRLERSPFYECVKMELWSGAMYLYDILKSFNDQEVKPIIEANQARIKRLNWLATNSDAPLGA